MAFYQQGPNRLKRVATIVPKAHHKVETPLANPDLGQLLPCEADAHRSNHIPRREPDASGRRPIDADLQLRQSRQLLGTEERAGSGEDRVLGVPGRTASVSGTGMLGEVGITRATGSAA